MSLKCDWLALAARGKGQGLCVGGPLGAKDDVGTLSAKWGNQVSTKLVYC